MYNTRIYIDHYTYNIMSTLLEIYVEYDKYGICGVWSGRLTLFFK